MPAEARIMITRLLAAAMLATSTLHGDFDCDGRTDTVLLQQGAGKVIVDARFADPNHHPQRFVFAVDSAREDAVCRLPVHLVVEGSGKCKGFAVVDEACDSLHFYWDRRSKRLEWWRL